MQSSPILTEPHKLRDIRPDLKERLRAKTAEREAMRAVMENLDIAIELLEQMIAEEERRFNVAPTAQKTPPKELLSEFVLQQLRAGKPKTKDDLRWLAEQAGYDVDGRSIHAALVALLRTARAKEVEQGQFVATS